MKKAKTRRSDEQTKIIPDGSSIPSPLTSRDVWIPWKLVERDDGKTTKKPCNAEGIPISPTDPANFTSFERAVQIARESDEVTGVGYCFTDGGPLVGIDFDDCRNPDSGQVDGWALDVIETLGTWTEISPSLTGLHSYIQGGLPGKGKQAGPIEIYDRGRFFTVTGQTFDAGKNYLADGGETLQQLYERVSEAASDEPHPDNAKSNGTTPRDFPDVSVYEHPDISPQQFPEGERCGHPFHSSSTNQNFHVDKGGETVRCWRHGVTYNAHQLVAVSEGIVSCGEYPSGSDQWHKIFEACERLGIETPEGDEYEDTDRNDSHTRDEENPICGNLPEGTDTIGDANRKELAWASAEFLSRTDEIKAVRTRDGAELFRYNDGIWTPGGEQKIGELVRPHVGTEFTSGLQNEIANHLRAINPVDRDVMGVPAGKVAVENGVLDLETCELQDHKPDNNALWKMTVQFDANASCEPFTEYLREVVQNEQQQDVIATIFEFMGYALQSRTHHKKALMVFGPTDSGKSVMFKVIQALFGEENDAGQPLQDLSNTRWGKAQLYGKPINTRADLGPGSIEGLGIIKEITSGDRIDAEFKNKDLFRFTPTTKLMFSANQAPQRDTEDEAFWNRWITVKFPEQIPDDEQDTQLVDKLTKPEVLSGILNEAIAGWHRLQEQKEFSYEPGPWETKDLWLEYGNTLQQFLQEGVEVTGESDDFVAKDKLYSAYRDYARERADKVETKNKLTRTVKKVGGDAGRKRINGSLTQVYTGVILEADDIQPGFD